jgi:hypothetical protein
MFGWHPLTGSLTTTKMAALTSNRCLAGSKAFTGLRPRQASAVSNGVKVCMGRKDSYMVEVSVDHVFSGLGFNNE